MGFMFPARDPEQPARVRVLECLDSCTFYICEAGLVLLGTYTVLHRRYFPQSSMRSTCDKSTQSTQDKVTTSTDDHRQNAQCHTVCSIALPPKSLAPLYLSITALFTYVNIYTLHACGVYYAHITSLAAFPHPLKTQVPIPTSWIH